MKLLLIFLTLFLLATPVFAVSSLDSVNQHICDRWEEDLNKMASIMEEVKGRKGIKETRVAYGGIDTPIKSADYWVTYAAEALAYQRAQKFSNNGQLKYSLEGLRQKILKAKYEVGKVI